MASSKVIIVFGMTLGTEMLHVNQHIIVWKIEVSNIIHRITQVHSGFNSVITVTFVWAISGSKTLSKIWRTPYELWPVLYSCCAFCSDYKFNRIIVSTVFNWTVPILIGVNWMTEFKSGATWCQDPEQVPSQTGYMDFRIWSQDIDFIALQMLTFPFLLHMLVHLDNDSIAALQHFPFTFRK